MASDKARGMPYQCEVVAKQAIGAGVRIHRPELSEGQYLYVVGEVFQLLCHDTDDALLEQPVEKWTPNLLDFYFTNKVGDYLVKLEIKTGRMILYGEEA